MLVGGQAALPLTLRARFAANAASAASLGNTYSSALHGI
jgi:hypothetical protein